MPHLYSGRPAPPSCVVRNRMCASVCVCVRASMHVCVTCASDVIPKGTVDSRRSSVAVALVMLLPSDAAAAAAAEAE